MQGAHKLRACDICSSIKQVCERENPQDHAAPCARCARLELPCTITRVHKPMGRPRRARPMPDGTSSPPPSSSPSPTPLGPHPPEPTEEEVTRFFNELLTSPTPEPQRPASASPQPTSHSAPSSSTSSAPARYKTRIRRSTSGLGCFSCKRRRKKCNEAFPVCGECARLGFVCERPCKPQTPHSTALARRRSASVRDEIPQPFSVLHGFDRSESHLLRHYSDVVVRCLSVTPSDSSPFASLFIPMVVAQPVARKALLCLSASHLRRQHGHFASEMIRYRDESFASALALVRSNDREALTEGLAAILLLCIQEVCEGRSPRWSRHLAAAVNIIGNAGGPSSFPPELAFLIEATAYFDSIATISFSRAPLLDPSCYLDPAKTRQEHALFGAAHELIALIASLGSLSEDRFKRFASPAAYHHFKARVDAIEYALQAWTPPENVGPVSIAAGICLQWGALMRLHQISSGYDLSHPRIRVGVQNILDAMDTIPDGHDVESMLVFPMFMAGLGAIGQERARVKRRFEVMKGSIGFGNVWDALDLVELLWKRMEEDGVNGMRWEELVEEEGGSLILS